MHRTRGLPLALAALLLASAPASAGKAPPAVESIKLRDKIHMLQGRGANVGVLAGKDGVLLIDTQYQESTGALRTAIGKISPKPVRYLVITHWHGDHVGGNQSLAESGTTVISHDQVRAKLRSGQVLGTIGRQIPPSPEAALPTVTYSVLLTFHFNQETVRCIHIPRAHTDGDTLVHFVESNVIHMGDIFFNGMYPYIDVNAGGNIDGMIRAVNQGLALADADTIIIPGHGPVAKHEDLKKYLFMLESIRDQVRPLVRAGMSLKEVLAAKPSSKFDARWGKMFLKPAKFTEIVYQGMQKTVGLQTTKEALQIVCSAPLQAPPDWKQVLPAERMALLARWVDSRLKNPEVIKIFNALGQVNPAEKPRLLRQAAKQAGIDRCPLADIWSP